MSNTKKNEQEKHYPVWFGGKSCFQCKSPLHTNDYTEIGFFTKGENKGKLFIRYKCKECLEQGIILYGNNNFNLLKICTLIVEQSNFMREAEKIQWKRKNILEAENNAHD